MDIITILYNVIGIYMGVSDVYSIKKEIEEAKDAAIWLYTRVSERSESGTTADSTQRAGDSGEKYLYR